jgi:hypothetical protein
VPSDFGKRIDELIVHVGEGMLTGICEVDQLYAHYQHEDLGLKHPRGGSALYLSKPFLQEYLVYMGRLAREVLGGRELHHAMAENMDDLTRQVSIHAPVEFGYLRVSGHATVESDGVVVYDRPGQRRLTEQELQALHAHLH